MTPEDKAAYWFAREQTAQLTRPERAVRDQWLQEPLHREAYERARQLWEQLGALGAHAEIRTLRRDALQARPAAPAGSRRRWMAAVAVTAGVTVGGYALQSYLPVFTASRYQTAVGERSTVSLPDGSSIVLNTATSVRPRFTGQERVVEITRGQAYFSVAKNSGRPFVVLAGGRRVTALGTAFDVRLDPGRLQVVLVEGKVAVNDLELQPGEQFVSRGAVDGAVGAADIEAVTSWRSGRIVFNETSLAEAVAEVNRYRERPIVIDEPQVGALKISGTFRVSEANRFPQALAAYYPLEAVVRASGETVLRLK